LTSIYVYGARKGESPCPKYTCITEETWQQFVQIRESEKWEVSIIICIYFIPYFTKYQINFIKMFIGCSEKST